MLAIRLVSTTRGAGESASIQFRRSFAQSYCCRRQVALRALYTAWCGSTVTCCGSPAMRRRPGHVHEVFRRGLRPMRSQVGFHLEIARHKALSALTVEPSTSARPTRSRTSDDRIEQTGHDRAEVCSQLSAIIGGARSRLSRESVKRSPDRSAPSTVKTRMFCAQTHGKLLETAGRNRH